MRRLALALVVLVAAALAVPLLPAAAGASPSVLHVSPAGSDAAPGTEAAPFRTLTHAIATLAPGDTLLVHGGEYVERITNPAIQRGTAAAPITIAAAPGEQPVVRGLFWLRDADHWTISGLGVTWAETSGPNEHMVKMTGGVGWRITGSTFWGARSYSALLIAGEPSGFRVDHNVIRDTAATNDTNQDHLIYVNAGMGGGTIEHNVLANSPNGRGIKIGPSSSSDPDPIGNLVVRNNTFFNNMGPSNIQLSYTATGNLIERNVFQRPKAGRAAVTAYNLEGTGNVVRDNVAWETDEVAEDEPGVSVAPDNRLVDPQLVDPSAGDFRIGNPALAGYGAEPRVTVALPLPDLDLPVVDDVVEPEPTPEPTPDPEPEPVVVAPQPAPAPAVSVPTPPARPSPAAAAAPAPARPALPSARGYRMMASDGGIFTFGDAAFHGSTGDLRLNQPIVGGASSPSGNGYWLVASDGGVFTFGDAAFHGSTGHLRLNQPIAAMAATPSGQGYWLVARDGGIFTFGDAAFHGSAAGQASAPVVALAPTASGQGYWIVTADGNVFAFGDAPALGRASGLNQPIVGMAATPTGQGYWLVARDGGIFTFGDATFHGSTGDIRLNQPIVGLSATPAGYRLVAADGGVFTFGDATFLGSTGNLRLNRPILAFL